MRLAMNSEESVERFSFAADGGVKLGLGSAGSHVDAPHRSDQGEKPISQTMAFLCGC